MLLGKFRNVMSMTMNSECYIELQKMEELNEEDLEYD